MFNPENLFWRTISRGVDIVGLSLLWAALCLPIVTAGAATSALYYTVVKAFRQGEKDTFHMYWDSFKLNLKPCIGLSIGTALFLVALGYGYLIMQSNWSTNVGQILFVTYDILMMVPLGILNYVFPLQGRFDKPTKELLMNACFMAMRHLPSTIILTLFTIEIVIGTVQYWWPIFFAPVLWAFVASLFLEKIFLKYITPDQKEELDPPANPEE